MTLDFISLTLHLDFMGWSDTRGGRRGGLAVFMFMWHFLGMTVRKGQGLSLLRGLLFEL